MVQQIITFDGGKYYVYKHTFENNSIYIGKGTNNRAYRFDKSRSGSRRWMNAYNKYGKPSVDILCYGLSETDSLEFEEFVISEYRDSGYDLCNLTDGGEGVSGYRHTDNTKKLLRNIALSLSDEQKDQSRKTQFKSGHVVPSNIIEKRTRTRMEKKSNMKKVRCINTNVVFDSLKCAAKWCGIKHNGISHNIKGINKSAGRHPETNEKLTWELCDD